MNTELLEQVERAARDIGGFIEKNTKAVGDLDERLSRMESTHDRPRSAAKAVLPYREVYTAEGTKAFLLNHKQRFSDVPELTGGDSDVSLARILGALAFGSNCGDKEAVKAANELKSTGTGTSGITLQNTVAAEFIDMVRAQSVLFNAGAQSISMPTQAVSFIHVTADATASWRSSEGASLSATDPSFAARTLTAKTIAVRTQISLEAVQDVPDAGQQIARAHSGAIAAAIDLAGIRGTSPAPAGLHTAAGVGSVTSVGTPTSWDDLVTGATTFLNANNALSDLTGIVMHPNVWSVYAKLKTGISSDNTPLQKPPEIANVPIFVSTGADTVASPEDYHVVLGNFGDLLVGFRMDPTIRMLDNTTSYASNLLIEVVGVARVDIVALRPASFTRLEDVTTF